MRRLTGRSMAAVEPFLFLPESTESLARKYGIAYLRLFTHQSGDTVEASGEAAIA
jgi:hypothetical protein